MNRLKKIRENNSIYSSLKKKIKYLGVSITKDAKDFYK
jgi:hypothetical protein